MARKSKITRTRRIYRTCRDVLNLMRFTPDLSRMTGINPILVSRIAFHMLLVNGYTPKEIRDNGILASLDPLSLLKSRISKAALCEIQDRLNPPELLAVTEDKAIFHSLMEANGVLVPSTIAVLFHGYLGRLSSGQVPRTRTEWLRELDQTLPDEFVVKPARGALGAGLRFYRREDNQMLRCLGSEKQIPLEELLDTVASDQYYRCYLFQERLANHPGIEKLTGAQALQTARVVTLLGGNNEVEIFLARWRISGPGAYTDNFCARNAGGMLAQLDLNTGKVLEVVQRGKNGRYIETTHHPVTGECFSDFSFPHWGELRELAARAARALTPVRSIGWDIACTGEGPVIVEANSRWDPPNESPQLGPVIERLQLEASVN